MRDDWADFLAALLDAEARFLVVGAHAVAAQGVPRATIDLDVWVEPTTTNAQRVWQALTAFGAPLAALGLTLEDFSRPDTVVQFGVAPVRIDVLTAISGVPSFDEAWSRRTEHAVRGRIVPFLGRPDLLANKRASGRHKDKGDLEALGESPE